MTDDGLEVREVENGYYQVFDTITKRFLGKPVRSKHLLSITLDDRRRKFRGQIVRWIYGIPTREG